MDNESPAALILEPGTLYQADVVAVNENGASNGVRIRFTTPQVMAMNCIFTF